MGVVVRDSARIEWGVCPLRSSPAWQWHEYPEERKQDRDDSEDDNQHRRVEGNTRKGLHLNSPVRPVFRIRTRKYAEPTHSPPM
jgi:hypothetical protein